MCCPVPTSGHAPQLPPVKGRSYVAPVVHGCPLLCPGAVPALKVACLQESRCFFFHEFSVPEKISVVSVFESDTWPWRFLLPAIHLRIREE